MSQIVPRYYRMPAAVFLIENKAKILIFTSWLLLPLFELGAWRLALGNFLRFQLLFSDLCKPVLRNLRNAVTKLLKIDLGFLIN